MINRACPAIVLDDKKEHLWAITHGLSVCGFPVMPHWVCDKQLEFSPAVPYQGVRLIFTDLHILGDDENKLETLVSALISFIKKLVAPSSYLLVFWSEYEHEADDAWVILEARMKDRELLPFGYRKISKTNVLQISDGDRDISKDAVSKVQREIHSILQDLPQLQALFNMEACISSASAKAVNGLVGAMQSGRVGFLDTDNVRKVMQRMSQEALGSAHAPSKPASGFAQAMMPIFQDCWERIHEDQMPDVKSFLGTIKKGKIQLPESIPSRLNNYFIHAEGNVSSATERGALINMSEEYLCKVSGGFCSRIGLNGDTPGDWRESICSEFAVNWKGIRTQESGVATKSSLLPQYIYAVELSPECDHAQNKQRSQRFFVAIFVPNEQMNAFSKTDKDGIPTFEPANAAIYVTPEIFLRNVAGRLFVSCRQFISKPHNQSPPGECVSRLRKDSIEELAHHYASHLRRPGKICFD